MFKPYRHLERLVQLGILIVAGSLALSGCTTGSVNTNTPSSTTAPTIQGFTAAQSAITVGGSTTLNWQVSGSTPLTLSLNQGIGTVTGNSYSVSPVATTTYTLTATNSAGQVSKNVTVTVTAANQAPTVSSPIANKNVTQGAAAQTVSLSSVFADAEDGAAGLTYSVQSSSLGVVSPSVAGSTLTLNFGNAGTAQVTVTAKDSGNLSISSIFSVTVTSNGNPPVNQAPVVVNPIANKTVGQGAAAQTADLKTVFNDAEDGTNLTYSASSNNPSIANASVTGSSLNLTFGSAGTTQITLTAKDSGNLSITSTFSVTVSAGVPSNQNPTVTSPISSKNVNQGAAAQTVNLQTVFNDAEDGTNLTFSATSSDSSVVNASVGGNTLTLTFGNNGTAQVTVSAKDSGNLSISTNFSVTVTFGGSGTNTAPTVVSTIANKNVTQGAAAQTVNLTPVFTDAQDGTNLTYSASSSNGSIANASVSGSTVNLTFGSTGTAQIIVTAKDSGQLSVSTSFSVTVASSGGGGNTGTCISSNFMTVTQYTGTGSTSLPNVAPTLTVTCSNGKAMVATNAIPNHAVGTFPNANNPNTISAQTRSYPLTLSPLVAASVTTPSLGTMGVAVNGIALEPMANEYYQSSSANIWQYEAMSKSVLNLGKNLGLDSSSAHVQPNGNYHYHGLPYALVTLINKGSNMTLIGYLGDGFPVYAVYGYNTATDASSGTKEVKSSYRLKSGARQAISGAAQNPTGNYDGTYVQDYEYVAGLGDLDACNGRFGVTPEYPSGIYHYYMTKTFPYISRCFTGTPESMYLGGGR